MAIFMLELIICCIKPLYLFTEISLFMFVTLIFSPLYIDDFRLLETGKYVFEHEFINILNNFVVPAHTSK